MCKYILCTESATEPNRNSEYAPIKIGPFTVSEQGRCKQVMMKMCNNGYYQEYINTLLQCNEVQSATEEQRECQTNSLELVCTNSLLGGLSYAMKRVCGSSPTSCTPECRDFLTAIRATLGCCISDYSVSLSLWSLCDVKPVTEECASTVTLHPTQVDPSCNKSNADTRYFADETM